MVERFLLFLAAIWLWLSHRRRRANPRYIQVLEAEVLLLDRQIERLLAPPTSTTAALVDSQAPLYALIAQARITDTWMQNRR